MTVTINNIEWKIKVIPSSSGELIDNYGNHTIGMTDSNQYTIFIDNSLNGQLLYKVLCHELVHAYCFSYGIYMDEEDEEHLAQFISEYGKSIMGHTDKILGNMVKYAL